MEQWTKKLKMTMTQLTPTTFFRFPGALPGTAEQDAGDQMESSPGTDHYPLQH